jgi:hypothetical protein
MLRDRTVQETYRNEILMFIAPYLAEISLVLYFDIYFANKIVLGYSPGKSVTTYMYLSSANPLSGSLWLGL